MGMAFDILRHMRRYVMRYFDVSLKPFDTICSFQQIINLLGFLCNCKIDILDKGTSLRLD